MIIIKEHKKMNLYERIWICGNHKLFVVPLVVLGIDFELEE